MTTTRYLVQYRTSSRHPWYDCTAAHEHLTEEEAKAQAVQRKQCSHYRETEYRAVRRTTEDEVIS